MPPSVDTPFVKRVFDHVNGSRHSAEEIQIKMNGKVKSSSWLERNTSALVKLHNVKWALRVLQLEKRIVGELSRYDDCELAEDTWFYYRKDAPIDDA